MNMRRSNFRRDIEPRDYLCSIGGGGGGGGQQQAQNTVSEVDSTTETTQTTTIEPYIRGIQENLYGTLNQFLKVPLQSYPGQSIAPLAPQQLLSNALLTGATTDPRQYTSGGLADLAAAYAASPIVGQASTQQLQALSQYTDPRFLDPRSNPFTAAAADAATRQTLATLTNQALPAIRTGAIGAGQYGGSRQGIAEGQAITGASQAMADAITKTYFDQYNRNALLQQQAIAQTPQALLAPLSTATQAINMRDAANSQLFRNLGMLDAAGTQIQSQGQQMANAEAQKWMQNNQLALAKMGTYLQGIGTLASLGIGSTTTGTSSTLGTTIGQAQVPVPGISPVQGAIAGGLAGASIGGSLSSAGIISAGVAPWFAVGGALLGLFA